MVSAKSENKEGLSFVQTLVKELGFAPESTQEACETIINRILNEGLVDRQTWEQAVQKAKAQFNSQEYSDCSEEQQNRDGIICNMLASIEEREAAMKRHISFGQEDHERSFG